MGTTKQGKYKGHFAGAEWPFRLLAKGCGWAESLESILQGLKPVVF